MFGKEETYKLNNDLVIQVLYPNDPLRREVHVLNGGGVLIARITKEDRESGLTTYSIQSKAEELPKRDPRIDHLEEFLVTKHFLDYQRTRRMNWLQSIQRHRRKSRDKKRNR
jgi:hypothetical protein